MARWINTRRLTWFFALCVLAASLSALAQEAVPTGVQPWDLKAIPQPNTLVFYDTPAGASNTGKPVDIGDINGDGCGDLAITGQNATFQLHGAWRSSAGHVRVVFDICKIDGRIAMEEAASPSSAVVTIYGAHDNDMFGTEIAIGDFNADGFDDLLVGAQNSSGPEQSRYNAGSVYVIPGSPRFIERGDIDLRNPPEDVLVFHGARSEDRFGIWVETGDFDADGFDDMLIGANQADGVEDRRVNGGEVWIFYGAENLLETYGAVTDMRTPPPNATVVIGADYDDLLGSAVWGADVNGDGYDDALLSAALWRGSAGVGGQSFGGGDGPGNQRYNSGETFIVFGTPDLRGQTIDLAEQIDQTGRPLNKNIAVIYGRDANDLLGEEIATGDLDGDGQNDIVLGTLIGDGPDNDLMNSGEAWVIYTSRPIEGAMIDLAMPESWQVAAIYPDQPESKGGDTIRVADLDGDGVDDLLYGAPDYDPTGLDLNLRRNAGMLAVIFSEVGGLPTQDGQLVLPSQAPDSLRVHYVIGADENDMMAYAMAVGDVNADGIVDVAPNAMGGDGAFNSQRNAGEIYLLDGSLFLNLDAPRWTLGRVGTVATPVETSPTSTPIPDFDTSQPGDAERGEMLFVTACAGCHGIAGTGGVGVPLVESEFVRNTTDEDLLHFLQVGRSSDHPDNQTGVNMPPFGGRTDWGNDELWDVVAYLRQLTEQP